MEFNRPSVNEIKQKIENKLKKSNENKLPSLSNSSLNINMSIKERISLLNEKILIENIEKVSKDLKNNEKPDTIKKILKKRISLKELRLRSNEDEVKKEKVEEEEESNESNESIINSINNLDFHIDDKEKIMDNYNYDKQVNTRYFCIKYCNVY